MALLALVWRAVVVATPLLGVWFSSSLLAWSDGPREYAVVGGVLLFPVVPLAWEALGARRFARRIARAQAQGRDAPRRFLTTTDRLVLRTLLVNGLFVGGLLAAFPKPAFTALATRGDWFLDGRDDDVARKTRAVLFTAATWLEWLHELANPNPYKKDNDDHVVPKDVKPVAEEKDPTTKDPTTKDPTTKDPITKETTTGGKWRVGDTTWPHAAVLHPAVQRMPASAETSIASVATYLAAQEPEPFARTKALHDWVVSRLHYDHDSLTGPRKAQDAESVFRNRMAVCEGYARLLVELGKFAGIPIEYVVGEVRQDDGRQAPMGHAWNAAQMKGQWYFLDATWDDPVALEDQRPTTSPTSATDAAHPPPTAHASSNYQTDYLFTPPSVALYDHLPDDPRWQLLPEPLDRGAFLRQRTVRPGLAKFGIELVSPERPVVDTDGDAIDVVFANPRGRFLFLEVTADGGTDKVPCTLMQAGEQVRAHCPLPGPGRFDIRVFASNTEYGMYDGVARLSVSRH
jgi:transglutaminase-like putative cysteine protease